MYSTLPCGKLFTMQQDTMWWIMYIACNYNLLMTVYVMDKFSKMWLFVDLNMNSCSVVCFSRPEYMYSSKTWVNDSLQCYFVYQNTRTHIKETNYQCPTNGQVLLPQWHHSLWLCSFSPKLWCWYAYIWYAYTVQTGEKLTVYHKNH